MIRTLKKIKFLLFYTLYQMVKFFPKSSSHTLTKGKIRSYFASKIMKSCGKHVNVEKGATFSCRISVGNNSGLGVNCQIQGTVLIGDNVMMGPEVYIYTTNHEYSRTDIPMCKQGYQPERPVKIEDDVWIGSRVTIMPGVTVGTGAVIAAGALVTKDVTPFSVVGGVPAKVLKWRK